MPPRAKPIPVYQRGAGEQAILAARDLAVTCFKPSIIFGPDDNFYNQFATLLKLSPVAGGLPRIPDLRQFMSAM